MGCGSSRINPGGDTEAATPRPNPAKNRNGLVPNGESNYEKKTTVDTNANISNNKPGKYSYNIFSSMFVCRPLKINKHWKFFGRFFIPTLLNESWKIWSLSLSYLCPFVCLALPE